MLLYKSAAGNSSCSAEVDKNRKGGAGALLRLSVGRSALAFKLLDRRYHTAVLSLLPGHLRQWQTRLSSHHLDYRCTAAHSEKQTACSWTVRDLGSMRQRRIAQQAKS